jgi:hypothetical protein
MTTFQIGLLYALFVGIFFFGLWQWRSRESDPVEKGFGFMYVGLSVLFLFVFSIGVLTGNV